MKIKVITSAVILLILMITAGCTVDSYTGSVTVSNYSDKDSQNVKVGNLFVGHVKSGRMVTVYFKIKQEAAQISADGFSPPAGYEGKIRLLFNRAYSLKLLQQNGSYYYQMTSELANCEDAGSMY